jgi:acetate kinase
VELDEEANAKARGEIRELTTRDSKIRAFLIPTNEELVIARDTVRLARLIQ